MKNSKKTKKFTVGLTVSEQRSFKFPSIVKKWTTQFEPCIEKVSCILF